MHTPNITQESLLLEILVPFINKNLGIDLPINDFSIKYLTDETGIGSSFQLYTNDIFHSLNVFAYTQYSANTSLAELQFENVFDISQTIVAPITINGTPTDLSFPNSGRIGYVLSMLIGMEFFMLPSGNIKPFDYQIPLFANTLDQYSLLVNNQNVLLLENGNAIFIHPGN
jgi:hypothetical protein